MQPTLADLNAVLPSLKFDLLLDKIAEVGIKQEVVNWRMEEKDLEKWMRIICMVHEKLEENRMTETA